MPTRPNALGTEDGFEYRFWTQSTIDRLSQANQTPRMRVWGNCFRSSCKWLWGLMTHGVDDNPFWSDSDYWSTHAHDAFGHTGVRNPVKAGPKTAAWLDSYFGVLEDVQGLPQQEQGFELQKRLDTATREQLRSWLHAYNARNGTNVALRPETGTPVGMYQRLRARRIKPYIVTLYSDLGSGHFSAFCETGDGDAYRGYFFNPQYCEMETVGTLGAERRQELLQQEIVKYHRGHMRTLGFAFGLGG